MSNKQTLRIPVTPNEKVITVNLSQDHDLLEILSLKFTQTDVYSSGLCSDYGVVAGRVSANNGLGIPNAKISIFIPLNDGDEIDPIISSLYPYKSTTDKNDNGYRYNLLPKRKQHGGHEPTGTFFDQEDILTHEEYLEVFENYYTYTVKSNASGDFMIWGVPVGKHQIHIDIDLSDIGCFSLRPYDFIRKGVGEGQFKRFYEFNSSSDIDSLPQIVKFDKDIEVYPFIGNEELCEIGITRVDYDLSESGIKIEPVAILLMSAVTDDDSMAIKKNGVIKTGSGYKCNLQTSEGKVESVRFTGGKVLGSDGIVYPELEYFNIPQSIDENGAIMIVLPMNIEYIYTNEFGEQEITTDKNRGIPTKCISRFRFSLNGDSNDPTTAKYLVPNIREFNSQPDGTLNEYDPYMLLTYMFSDVFEDYLKLSDAYSGVTNTPMSSNDKIFKKNLILNNDINTNELIPQDYFYKFTYGKVYTVSSFQGTYFQSSFLATDNYLGIKEIRPGEDSDCAGSANYFPINYAHKNTTTFKLIVNEFLLFISYLFSMIFVVFFELLGGFFKIVGDALWNFYIHIVFAGIELMSWRPFAGLADNFRDTAYKLQSFGTQQLSLTVYPDCTDCTLDNESVQPARQDLASLYPSVGEIKCKVFGNGFEFTDRWGAPYLLPIEARGLNEPTYLPGQYGQNKLAADSGYTTQYYITGFTEGSIDGSTVSGRKKQKAYQDYMTLLYSASPVSLPEDPNNPTRFMAQISAVIDESQETRNKYKGTSTTHGGPAYDYSASMGKLKSYSFRPFNVSIKVPETDYNFPAMSLTGLDECKTCVDPSTGTIYWNVVDRAEGNQGGYGKQITKWLQTWGTFCEDDVLANGYPLARAFVTSPQNWSNNTGVDYSNYSGGTYNATGQTAYDRDLFVIVKIFDRQQKLPGVSGSTIQIESGCEKYDTFYDESVIKGYIVGSEGAKYGDSYLPPDPPNYPSGSLVQEVDSSDTNDIPIGETILSTIAGTSTTERLPRYMHYNFGGVYYDRKTKSGLTEIRNGLITLVPVISGGGKNLDVLSEWYRRKRIGMNFCAGIVNYSFVDNWLSGVLYFFKFRKRIVWDNEANFDLGQRSSKYPKDMVFFNVLDNNFYYRSTPFNTTNGFIGNKSINSILHPTTFYDVGIRDEFFYEICSDPTLDPTCSVIRDITSTSYQDPGPVVEYGLIYRMDVSKKTDLNSFFNNFHGNIRTFDGDFLQLISINCETGIEAIDLDSPHYFMFDNSYFDAESNSGMTYFKSGGTINDPYGPVAIDVKFDSNGSFIRSCLNSPNRLGDYTQTVPFYLWDKKGEGFGAYSDVISDTQNWDKSNIVSMPLQRIYSVNAATDTVTNYLMADNEEEYLLRPMTINHDTYKFAGNFIDSLERFEFITKSGDTPSLVIGGASAYTENQLWLEVISGTTSDPLVGKIYVVRNKTWKLQSQNYISGVYETFIFETSQNYSGTKQVLSTPFLFYFGLKPNKTSLDLLTKYYGPKGAFTPTD